MDSSTEGADESLGSGKALELLVKGCVVDVLGEAGTGMQHPATNMVSRTAKIAAIIQSDVERQALGIEISRVSIGYTYNLVLS